MLDDRPAMHLYGGAIGVVSGAYSLNTLGMNMMGGMPLLSSLIGLAALVHGILLVTAYAERIGRYNGPLMVAYAAGMLLAAYSAWMDTMMAVDGGMVALALLMLVSGLIMMDRYDGM